MNRIRSMLERRNTWVGVGVVLGNSEKFGPDRYWIVVIYAAAKT